jgi:very-short-patch-repair endonuclease
MNLACADLAISRERNKEQAAKDKSRDRELAGMGIQVMRFTGSEIHRDAAKCVLRLLTSSTGVATKRWRFATQALREFRAEAPRS